MNLNQYMKIKGLLALVFCLLFGMINAQNLEVVRVAGTGLNSFQDGPAATACFNNPTDVTADQQGNLYISEFGNARIRKIDPAGYDSTFAGSGVNGFADGVEIQLYSELGVKLGKLYEGEVLGNEQVSVDIDGSHYTAGLYFIRLATRSGWEEEVKLILIR